MDIGKVTSYNPIDITKLGVTEMDVEIEKGYQDMLESRTRPSKKYLMIFAGTTKKYRATIREFRIV